MGLDVPKLSALEVESATVPKGQTTRLCDLDGLSLVVMNPIRKGRPRKRKNDTKKAASIAVDSTVCKKWVLRYQIAGRRRDMGLGTYPAISLKEARELARTAQTLIVKGIDPIERQNAARIAARPVPTFAAIAAGVIKAEQDKSTNNNVKHQWERQLSAVFCADILSRPVNEITTVDIANILRPLWKSKPETARKLHLKIKRVFESARVVLKSEFKIAMSENPACWDDLKAMGFESPPKLSRGRHPSLPFMQMRDFMSELREREGTASRGLEFLILTNVRTNTVIEAKWNEFDLEAAVWTIPLINLKDRRHREEPFSVPLSSRAVEIFQEMKKSRVSDYVFPGQNKDEPLSGNAFLALLNRMNGISEDGEVIEKAKHRWIDPQRGKAITPHGFRASFKTWVWRDNLGENGASIRMRRSSRVWA